MKGFNEGSAAVVPGNKMLVLSGAPGDEVGMILVAMLVGEEANEKAEPTLSEGNEKPPPASSFSGEL